MLVQLLAGLSVCVLAGDVSTHSEIRRANLDKVLPGFTIDTTDNGHNAFTFEDDHSVTFHGTSASGTGTWRVENEHDIVAEVTGNGGDCEDDLADCEKRTDRWSLRLKDVWFADSGLFVATDANGGKATYMCDPKRDCFPADFLVKVIPAAKEEDRDLFVDLISEERAFAVVEGKKAKRLRQTSEIWWVSAEGKASLKDVEKWAQPILGTVPVKKWEWEGPPYDVIIVVGAHKSK